MGKNNRGGINGSVLKEKEGDDYNDADSWNEHNFDVGGKDEAEWGNNKRDEDNSNNDDADIEEEEEEGKGDGSRM